MKNKKEQPTPPPMEEVPVPVLSHKEHLKNRLLSMQETSSVNYTDRSEVFEAWETMHEFSAANTLIYALEKGGKSVEEVMETMVPSEDSAVQILKALDDIHTIAESKQ